MVDQTSEYRHERRPDGKTRTTSLERVGDEVIKQVERHKPNGLSSRKTTTFHRDNSRTVRHEMYKNDVLIHDSTTRFPSAAATAPPIAQ